MVTVEVKVINGLSGIVTVKYLIPVEHLDVSALTHAVPSKPFLHTTSKNSFPPITFVEVLAIAIAGSTFQLTETIGSTLKRELTVPATGIGQTGRLVAFIVGILIKGSMVMVLQTQPASSLNPSLLESVELSQATGRTQTSN